MVVLKYFLEFLLIAFKIYSWIVMIWVLLSWFPVDRDNAVVRFFTSMVEPVYDAILRVLPPIRFGMMDFSILYFAAIYALGVWLLGLALRALGA